MKYYIAKDGKPDGPYTIEELKLRGITPDTLVWNETMTQWTQAGSVAELATYVLGGAQATDTLPNGGFQSCQAPPAPGYQQPYQQPYQQQYAPGYQQPDNNIMPACPKTCLAESILATLFCCLPFGIVGIVYAAQVSNLYNSCKYEEALEASRKAWKWTKISFFSGLALYIIYAFSIFLATGVDLAQ